MAKTPPRETRPANGDENTLNRGPKGGPTEADYAPMVTQVRSLHASATNDDNDTSWPEIMAILVMSGDASVQQAALVNGEFHGDVNAYKNFVQEARNRGEARRNATPEAQVKYSAYMIRKRITDAGGKSWPALDRAVDQQEANAKRYSLKWPPA